MNLSGINLLLFDVDGTLVKPKSGATFRKTADDWEWIPGRLEALRYLIATGHTKIALCTNQGGVGFGYFKAYSILAQLMRMVIEIFPDERPINHHRVHVCMHHPKASIEAYRRDDFRRKPKPGMLLEAMLDFEAGPHNTLMIGDMEDDKGAALAAACHFQWADPFFAGVQYEIEMRDKAVGTLADIIREHHPDGIDITGMSPSQLDEAILAKPMELYVEPDRLAGAAEESVYPDEAEMARQVAAYYEWANAAYGESEQVVEVAEHRATGSHDRLVAQVIDFIQRRQRRGEMGVSVDDVMAVYKLSLDEAGQVLAEAFSQLIDEDEDDGTLPLPGEETAAPSDQQELYHRVVAFRQRFPGAGAVDVSAEFDVSLDEAVKLMKQTEADFWALNTAKVARLQMEDSE